MDTEGHQPDVQQVTREAELEQRNGIGAADARPACAVAPAQQQRRGDRHHEVANEQEAAGLPVRRYRYL